MLKRSGDEPMTKQNKPRDTAPRLSAIVVVPTHFSSVKKTLAALRAQTISEVIELVLVAPAGANVDMPAELTQCFHSRQTVQIAELSSVAQGYAGGVRAASAPLVVFTEDHSFPEPDWAAALLAAYDRPFSAVGPAIYNANPTGLVSQADHYVAYGAWAGPQTSGERQHLPGHNSSYRREVLLNLEHLEAWLEAETLLHWELVRRGHHLYLAGNAHTYHTNFGQLPVWTWVLFDTGWRFAALRSAGWPWAKRLAYAAGSFLIPLVRLRRVLPQVRKANFDMRTLPFLLLILLWGFIVDGFGQLLGYSFGDTRSARTTESYEFDRERYI